MNRQIPYDEDIYVSVKQISQYLIGSQYIISDDSYTYMSRDDKETTLYLNDDKLMKKPGNEILLYNVDNLCFSVEDSYVYISITRDERLYNFMIGYAIEYEESNEE